MRQEAVVNHQTRSLIQMAICDAFLVSRQRLSRYVNQWRTDLTADSRVNVNLFFVQFQCICSRGFHGNGTHCINVDICLENHGGCHANVRGTCCHLRWSTFNSCLVGVRCMQESKPRPRFSRPRSSDYGGNIRRYNFRNSAANKRVFFFPG